MHSASIPPASVWDFLHCYKCLRSNCEIFVLSCGHLLCPQCASGTGSESTQSYVQLKCVECNEIMQGRLISPQNVPDDLQMFVTDPAELLSHVLKVHQFQQQHQQRLLQLLKRKVLEQKQTIKDLKIQMAGRQQTLQVEMDAAMYNSAVSTPRIVQKNPFPLNSRQLPVSRSASFHDRFAPSTTPTLVGAQKHRLTAGRSLVTPPISRVQTDRYHNSTIPLTPKFHNNQQPIPTPSLPPTPIDSGRSMQSNHNFKTPRHYRPGSTTGNTLTPQRPRPVNHAVRQNSLKWEKLLQANNASAIRASSAAAKRVPVDRPPNKM